MEKLFFVQFYLHRIFRNSEVNVKNDYYKDHKKIFIAHLSINSFIWDGDKRMLS